MQWTQATTCVHQPAEVHMSMITPSSRFPPLQPHTDCLSTQELYYSRTHCLQMSLLSPLIVLSSGPVCVESPINSWSDFGLTFWSRIELLTNQLVTCYLRFVCFFFLPHRLIILFLRGCCIGKQMNKCVHIRLFI